MVIDTNSSLYRALQSAWNMWRASPNTGDKYVFFETLAEEEYGIELHLRNNSAVAEFNILDDRKYALFLLRWS